MIADFLPIPLLDGEVPERLISDESDPSTIPADQDPVGQMGIISLHRPEPHLTQSAKGLIGFHDAKASGCSLTDSLFLKNLLQRKSLGLAS